MKKTLPKLAINITNLSKKYPGSDSPALDNLSLKIYYGEVYGFLGPNGAGKSTAIRLLMNFLKPTSGSAYISGIDIAGGGVDIKRSIGYLAGDSAMYPKMTGRQFLSYMSALQNDIGKSNIPILAKMLGADLDKKLGDLSRGNRQKVGIIQAFMHEPEVMILDEPTSGLDPLVQETFHKLIQEAKKRGACIFMSSHVLSEVQKMCDRIGIIREGKLISENNINEMALEAAQTFDIQFIKKAPISELRTIGRARVIPINAKEVTVHMNGKLSPLFSVLAKHDVKKIDLRNLDLEETFMHFYEGKEKK